MIAFTKKNEAYFAVAKQAFLRRIKSPADLSGRTVLFFVILTIWSKIWQVTAFGGFKGFSPSDSLWYLLATEWIVLSIPYVFVDIEMEVKNGDFAYNLLRPGSYAGYHLAQAMGLGAANWLALGLTSVPAAFLLTGHWPGVSLGVFLGIGLIGLSAVLATTFVMVTLGLFSLWTQDASPCAWVWQKLQFVLGGLMLPLSLYPTWLRDFSAFTPFPALLGNIAEPILHQSEAPALWVSMASIAMWACGFALILTLVFSRAIRKIQEAR